MMGDGISCSPERLAALVRARDVRALDALVSCHGSRLMAVAQRYCKNRADAEDAVQDALISAGTHLGDWRGEGSVEGWVIRMVANACAKMRRGRKNDPALHSTEIEPISMQPTVEHLAQRAEVGEQLADALAALDPVDRAILLLAEAEEWDSRRIAAEVNMTSGAVRTRLFRARKRLQTVLEPTLGEVARLGV